MKSALQKHFTFLCRLGFLRFACNRGEYGQTSQSTYLRIHSARLSSNVMGLLFMGQKSNLPSTASATAYYRQMAILSSASPVQKYGTILRRLLSSSTTTFSLSTAAAANCP